MERVHYIMLSLIMLIMHLMMKYALVVDVVMDIVVVMYPMLLLSPGESLGLCAHHNHVIHNRHAQTLVRLDQAPRLSFVELN
jgi:hypothetical protein